MPARKLSEVKSYREQWIVSNLFKYGFVRKQEVMEEFDCSAYTSRNDMRDVRKNMYDLYGAKVSYSRDQDTKLVFRNRDEVINDFGNVHYRTSAAVFYLLKHGEITTEKYMEIFGVGRRTAHQDMKFVIKTFQDVYQGTVAFSRRINGYVWLDRKVFIKELKNGDGR